MIELDKVKVRTICSDVDIPPKPDTADNPLLKTISKKEVKSLEQQKLDHEHDRDKWAFKTLKWCIICLVSIYAFERALCLLPVTQTSDFAGPVFETLKFLISSLIGFLFAKRAM